jgi:hypothetical protein
MTISIAYFVASHQGSSVTIPNYLVRELRYMDLGNKARGGKAGAKGTPGYQ